MTKPNHRKGSMNSQRYSPMTRAEIAWNLAKGFCIAPLVWAFMCAFLLMGCTKPPVYACVQHQESCA